MNRNENKKSFEDLEVWKRSCQLSVNIYKTLEKCRDFGLRDQMLRASISIPSNIAEGRERNSNAEFRRFLRIAKGSAAELRTQVYIAQRIKVVMKNEADNFINELKEISRMLQGLIKSIENIGKK